MSASSQHPFHRKMTIRRTSLQQTSLSRRLQVKQYYDVGSGILLEGGRTLLYVGFSGDDIRLDVREANLVQASNWMSGIGIAASTLFNGDLPLHAAGAAFDGQFFGLLAPSGTGKSTTLRALIKAGALFGSDDMIPVLFLDDHHTAFPAVSLAPKMHRTALEYEGISCDSLNQVSPIEDKFWMPLQAEQYFTEPSPLTALFLLKPTEPQTDDLCVQRLPTDDAATMLLCNLHGVNVFNKYVNMVCIKKLCDTLAQSVPVYTLQYRKRFEVLPQLTEAIRATLNSPVLDKAYF